MSVSLLQGVEQASDLDLVVLALKLTASGIGLGLLTVVAMVAWSIRGIGDGLGRVYTFFALANLFAALYVVADTGVRICALLRDPADTLLMVRLATAGVMLAMAAYICLYWIMEARERPPWLRVSALYCLGLLAGALLWVEHPALVVASDRVRFMGLSAFADYGAAAPWYYALLLLLVGGIVARLVRSPLRHSDRVGWHLNIAGLGLLLLAGVHDALRELNVILLPFPVLWLGFVCFQVGAFGFLALHYARVLREHRQQSVKLRRLSDALVRDGATGLFSRGYLQDLLSGGPHAGGLLFVDLDNFKTINDRYGHLCGDAVIGAVAELLRTTLRVGDVACRWGGDEFLVYLPYGDADQARMLAARLQLRASRLEIAGAPDLRIGLSMGYARLEDGDWRRSAELADRALYQSKRNGKGQLTVAAEEPLAVELGAI